MSDDFKTRMKAKKNKRKKASGLKVIVNVNEGDISHIPQKSLLWNRSV